MGHTICRCSVYPSVMVLIPTSKKKGPPCEHRRDGPFENAAVLLDGIDRNLLAVSANLKGHDAVDLGEKRVVTSLPDIPARMELGSTLTDDDAAGQDRFTSISFDTQELRVAVPPVSTGAHTFL